MSRMTREMAEELNSYPEMWCYGDERPVRYEPLHQKVRGRYASGFVRCQYCWCIPENEWGKCEQCGAPL